MTKLSVTVEVNSRAELEALMTKIYGTTQDFPQVQPQSSAYGAGQNTAPPMATATYQPVATAQGVPLPAGPSAPDPWSNPNPTAGPVQGAPVQQQQATQNYASPAQQQIPSVPSCAHGPMRFVQGGFSQRTNRAYAAFYGCQAQQGDPNKCKSVSA